MDSTTQESTKDNTNYLCCWRAEGAGDKYSAHSRSIDWSMVHKFYKNLLLINQKARILDITKWNHWESEGLRAIGVDIIDPRKGTLIDLINKCHISQVITIDTALAHLCAASGTKANLLLNIFPMSAGTNCTERNTATADSLNMAFNSIRLLVNGTFIS